MRILQVITSLQTGGAEKLIVDITRILRIRGHVVDVVVFDGKDTPFMKQLRETGCKVYSLSIGGSVYSLSYILKLRKIIRDYDVVHSHNTSPQFFVALANLCCKRIIVTTEHNLKKYLGEDKPFVTTIYNGVDVVAFYNAKPLDVFKEKKFVVVMVAAFRKQKDQKTLIDAMGLLSCDAYELWLVGQGDCLDDVRNYTETRGLQDRVKFWGNRTDVANVLHTADVVCMSSHYEGLSLSNIEGMSSGRPFVASDVDGLREVTKGYGILFPHGDAEALANIIRKLHDDKAYYDEVAEKCHQRALMFDINKMVDGYEAVYKELVHK